MKKFDIVLVDLNPVKGSEQAGIRPCLIIQNNLANKYAKTYVIAIISSVIKKYPHTLILAPDSTNNLDVPSRVDFLQVRTIDESRIIKTIGKCDQKDYEALNQALKIAFDI